MKKFIPSALLMCSGQLLASEEIDKSKLVESLSKAKKELSVNYQIEAIPQINQILEQDVTRLSDDEKNQLIYRLLEISNDKIEFQNNQLIKDERYLNEMGRFSFAHIER